jgi:hypothetical protein
MGIIDWIIFLLRIAPNDPAKAAQRFNERSSTIGDSLRPWLYGLIGGAVVLLLAGWMIVFLAS